MFQQNKKADGAKNENENEDEEAEEEEDDVSFFCSIFLLFTRVKINDKVAFIIDDDTIQLRTERFHLFLSLTKVNAFNSENIFICSKFEFHYFGCFIISQMYPQFLCACFVIYCYYLLLFTDFVRPSDWFSGRGSSCVDWWIDVVPLSLTA